MSSEIIGVGDSEPHQDFQVLQVLANPADSRREGASLRFVAEPCEKHAKTATGEQTWVEDSPVDPITGLQAKKRDPNGFVHGCPDCEAAAHVVKEA